MLVDELMHFMWYSVHHNPVKFRNLHTKAPIVLIYFTFKRMSLYAYWTKDEVLIDISLQILDYVFSYLLRKNLIRLLDCLV